MTQHALPEPANERSENERPGQAPRVRLVEQLPDLIAAEEYAAHPTGGLVRLRISVTPDGVAILGDAFRPEVLERLLTDLSPEEIQQMLCG